MNASEPIGYYLRQADQAITAHFARAIAEHGLTRFHWQVLNLLARGGTTARSALLATMRGFVDDEELTGLLDDLRDRGWLSGDDGALTLTAAGREGHRAVSAQVAAVRERSMRGVSEQDYDLVIATLRRIVRNLEPSA